MKYYIYFISSAKSPRRQAGKAAYLVQAYETHCSRPEMIWQRMFRFQFANENGDSSELLVLSHALEYVSKAAAFCEGVEICIRSGHGYIRDGYRWMGKWKKEGWKTSKGTQVKHFGLWKNVDSLTDGKTVTFGVPDLHIEQLLEEGIKVRPAGESSVS